MGIIKKWMAILLVLLVSYPPILANKITADEMNKMTSDRWNIIDDTEEYIEVKAICTFYTSLESCNGSGNSGKNAVGGCLNKTSIAIPRNSMPYGTVIEIDKIGTKVADDCGNGKYIKINEDGSYRFDIYVPRLHGENDKEYKERVLMIGKLETMAKIYYTGND